MMLDRRRVSVATLVAAALATFVAAPGLARAGGETHRVAVVVDLGDEVKTARVSFEGESITGLEALQLAGFGPVARSYGDQGGAVCSLCDRGCPADSTCLTCGGASYWAYFRAASGASSYSYSHVGAGATQVHDGDVEAWKWGPGVAPAFVSFADVWGESTTTAAPSSPPTSPPTSPATLPPTSRPGAAATATGAPPSATASVVGGAGPASTVTVTGAGVATPTVPSATGPGRTGVGATGTTGSATGSSSPGGGALRSATAPGGPKGGDGTGQAYAASPIAPPVDATAGGSGAGLVGFAAVVAGLGLWILRSRNARRRAPARS